MNTKTICRAAILTVFVAVAVSCGMRPTSPFGLDGSRPPACWVGTINTTEEADSLYLFASFAHDGGATNVVDLERRYYPGYPKNLIIDEGKEVHQEASVTLSEEDMDRIYRLFVRGISDAVVSFQEDSGPRSVTLQLLVGTLNITVTRGTPYADENAINSSAHEIMKIVARYDPKFTVTTER